MFERIEQFLRAIRPSPKKPQKLNDRLKAVISQGLGSVLLAGGYEESRPNERHGSCTAQFHSVHADHIRLVDVQRDKYWTNKRGKFAVNLGIHFPAVERMRGGQIIDGIPPGGCWTLTTRLGRLATGADKWWELTPRTAIQSLARDVSDSWITYGKPWIETHSDLRAARDWKDSNYGVWPAVIMSLVLGERDTARRLFRETLSDGTPRDGYYVSEAERMGLLDSTEADRLRWAVMQHVDTKRTTIDEVLGPVGDP